MAPGGNCVRRGLRGASPCPRPVRSSSSPAQAAFMKNVMRARCRCDPAVIEVRIDPDARSPRPLPKRCTCTSHTWSACEGPPTRAATSGCASEVAGSRVAALVEEPLLRGKNAAAGEQQPAAAIAPQEIAAVSCALPDVLRARRERLLEEAPCPPRSRPPCRPSRDRSTPASRSSFRWCETAERESVETSTIWPTLSRSPVSKVSRMRWRCSSPSAVKAREIVAPLARDGAEVVAIHNHILSYMVMNSSTAGKLYMLQKTVVAQTVSHARRPPQSRARIPPPARSRARSRSPPPSR